MQRRVFRWRTRGPWSAFEKKGVPDLLPTLGLLFGSWTDLVHIPAVRRRIRWPPCQLHRPGAGGIQDRQASMKPKRLGKRFVSHPKDVLPKTSPHASHMPGRDVSIREKRRLTLSIPDQAGSLGSSIWQPPGASYLTRISIYTF
jgi:hypothetical protein